MRNKRFVYDSVVFEYLVQKGGWGSGSQNLNVQKFKSLSPKSMEWIGGVTRLGLCPKIFRFSTASVMPW